MGKTIFGFLETWKLKNGMIEDGRTNAKIPRVRKCVNV
jgi:hypothetical protein